jgi:hypothetical protein
MTEQEWQETNRKVFTNHPSLAGGWKPGQMCKVSDVKCRHFDQPWAKTWEDFKAGKWAQHEIPPPDLREDSTFVRVLMATKADISHGRSIVSTKQVWWAHADKSAPAEYSGDTPHEALARALDAMESMK